MAESTHGAATIDPRVRDPGGGEVRGYFRRIFHSARTVLEGMAVTMAYVFQKPITVQYPDRTPQPLEDMLPERYRGFLEVDMDVCSACLACQRECPIDCIRIEVEKTPGGRAMTRFDIDVGKCMYCGICVEACGSPALAEGDAEETRAIRFTRECLVVTPNLSETVFRFVRPGDKVPPRKLKKGEPPPPSRRRGEIAREARRNAQKYNELALRWGRAREAAKARPADDAAAAAAVEAILAEARDPRALVAAVATRVLPGTDCTYCGHATCRAYAEAVLAGGDTGKCDPGGAVVARDLVTVVRLRGGRR